MLDNAKRFEWHLTMLAQGKDPESFDTLEDALQYYRQLYQADQMFTKLKCMSTKGGKSGCKKWKQSNKEDYNDGNDTTKDGNRQKKSKPNKKTKIMATTKMGISFAHIANVKVTTLLIVGLKMVTTKIKEIVGATKIQTIPSQKRSSSQ